MKIKIVSVVLTSFMAMMLVTRISFAADPLEVAPDMYKLKFENDRVRVMEVTFQPGQSIPAHSHPDHFVVVEQGGQLKLTKGDGGVAEVELKEGEIMWINAETHKATNTGTTVVRLLVTELKVAKN